MVKRSSRGTCFGLRCLWRIITTSSCWIAEDAVVRDVHVLCQLENERVASNEGVRAQSRGRGSRRSSADPATCKLEGRQQLAERRPWGASQMQIKHRALQKDGAGSIKVVAEDDEDIWHLYNLITAGDEVRASTSRKVQVRSCTHHTSIARGCCKYQRGCARSRP